MKKLRLQGHTLSGRIILFLVLFGIALVMQVILWRYQSTRILTPTRERTAIIQTTSQFLDGTNTCVSALADYRWDYGNAPALTEIVQAYRMAAEEQLPVFHAQP